ncbi:MAG: hypothetical protein ACE147_16180 [Candidatus Methylomirabilales bacterium]
MSIRSTTLICEGESGRVFEVTRAGDICWEWISPFVYPFKGFLSCMLFRAHRYAADSPELTGRDLHPGRWEPLNRQLGLAR